MLLRQMRYFVMIVRYGSFTDAAEACYISQSAISQQMKALEEELGVILMKREKRSFSLTPAGEYFYRHALGVIDEVERIKTETIQIGEFNDEHLSIGLLDGFSYREVRKALAEFSKLYPEVDIEIKTGTHEDLYRMVQSNTVDLVLNDQRRAFSDFFVNYHLTYSPCYVAISPQSPLSQLPFLSPDDLKRVPCVLVSSKEQQETEREYYRDIMGLGSEYLFVTNQETADIMVAANKGFSLTDGRFHHRETITYIPLYDGMQQMTRRYCLFWKKARASYYIEEFAHMLSKYFES